MMLVAMVTGVLLSAAVPASQAAHPMTTDEARADVSTGAPSAAQEPAGLAHAVPFSTDEARVAAGAQRAAAAATSSPRLEPARSKHMPASTDEARAAVTGV